VLLILNAFYLQRNCGLLSCSITSQLYNK